MSGIEDRAEVIRTQTIHALITALGGADVNVYGNDQPLGGVFLDNEQQIRRRLYWYVDGQRYAMDATVRCSVTWEPVG